MLSAEVQTFLKSNVYIFMNSVMGGKDKFENVACLIALVCHAQMGHCIL